MNKFGTAIILAGGKSVRMGFDKQFLEINQKKLMDLKIDELRKEFEEIIIVSNKMTPCIGVNYKVVCDEIKDIGPLGGIHVGLKNSKSQYAYFTACDMPIINIDYIRFMKDKIRDNIRDNIEACVTIIGNRVEPFNCFYSSSLLSKIKELIAKKNTAPRFLLNDMNTIYIDEEQAKKNSGNLNMFTNLNNTKDLANYLNSLKEKI